MNVSLVPSASSIAVDADALPAAKGAPVSGGLLASSAEGAQALSELPANAWLAVGLGNVGSSLATDVHGLTGALLGTLGGGSGESQGISVKGLLEGIVAPLSVLGGQSAEARRAFQSWMGSAGIFASGTGLVELRAGVAINSKNPALSRAAVGKVGEALQKSGGSVGPTSIPGTDAAIQVRVPGLPVELAIANGKAANGQTKFVIGLAEASVTAALHPAEHAVLRRHAQRRLGDARGRYTAQPDRQFPDARQPARRVRAQRRPGDLKARALDARLLDAHRRRQGPRRRSAAAAPGARAAAGRLSQPPSISRSKEGRPATTRSSATRDRLVSPLACIE